MFGTVPLGWRQILNQCYSDRIKLTEIPSNLDGSLAENQIKCSSIFEMSELKKEGVNVSNYYEFFQFSTVISNPFLSNSVEIPPFLIPEYVRLCKNLCRSDKKIADNECFV